MLNNWIRITDDLQSYKTQKDNNTYTFTLKNQDIGVYGAGKALVLKGRLLSDKSEVIACFWIKNDGYGTCEKKGYGKKLWLETKAIEEAVNIITNIVENVY